MVQAVFIHGVNVRKEPDPDSYEQGVADRKGAFAKYCFKGTPHTFLDPYWGGAGAKPKLGGRYLTTPAGSSLGFGGLGGARPPEPSHSETRLLEAAKADFGGVLNTLAITLAAGDAEDVALAEQIADYLVQRENDAGKVEAPDWLTDPAVRSDKAFVERLEAELRAAEAAAPLGLGSAIKKAAGGILGAGLNLVDGPIEKVARSITPKLAIFLGDAFLYLKEGQERAKIRQIITEDLLKAAQTAQANGEKLLVVGHSMGANIFYDMVTDTDWLAKMDADLGAAFRPDLFLSVGTQLGLFEELNLFTSSTADVAPFPSRLGDWWHVYNRMDVLSFAAEGIFEDVKQFSVNTKANIIDAHGAYFTSPVFQKRLRKRLLSAGLI